MDQYLRVFAAGLFVILVSHMTTVESRTIPKSRVVRNAADDIGEVHLLFDQIGGRKPVDLIVAMDRSKSMSEEVFYLRVKKLTKAILTQYATLDKEYVRLAIITFAINSTVEYDSISNPDTSLTKCALFNGEKAPWEDILYTDDLKETNIKAAFMDSMKIFRKGRLNRPDATQVIYLITDGKYNDENDPIQEATELKESLGVTIYAVGIGVWLEIGNVRILTSEIDDVHLYADYAHWVQYVKESGQYTSYAPDTLVEWSRMDTDACYDTCGSIGNSGCYCDIDRGFEKCMCTPGHYLNQSGNCVECAENTYKEGPGNDAQCTPCPFGMTSPTGSVSKSQCVCMNTSCSDPCEPNPCNATQTCVPQNETDFRCECKDGWEGPECDVNIDECARSSSSCQHESTCVDGIGTGVFSCVCTRWGYTGRFCEIEELECFPDLCENGANCTDKINNFECQCAEGFVGRYCQDMPPPTTPIPPTANPTPIRNPVPTGSTTEETQDTSTPIEVVKDDTMFWIIIGASAGGGLIVLIIIIVVSVCVCRKKKAEEDKNKEEVKDIARKFSGFWKKKTIRGSKWMEEEMHDEGLPSVPTLHRPDLLTDSKSFGSVENLKTDEYAEVQNQTMTLKTGMESWQNYITELEESKVIERAIIVKTGGNKTARTESWMFDLTEMTRLEELMDNGDVNVPVKIQDSEYQIQTNEDGLASGETISRFEDPKVVVIGRTKNYLITAIADADKDDGKAKKEVQWIVDHISGEGY